MELQSGDVVKVGHKRYQVVNVLGHGDQSVVYDARGQGGEAVALKVAPEPPQAGLSLRRVVQHPGSSHLVRVIDTERAQDGFLTVMERVEGVDLRDMLELLHREHRALSPRLAVEIVYQAIRGLQEAHDRSGQAHGDIKPANIMLDRHGVVKLLDFGWGQPLELRMRGKVPRDMEYLAPEQADLEGEWTPDIRSDLYALGVILYELVMGEPLHAFEPTATLYQQIMTVARGEHSLQLSRVQTVLPELAGFIHQALIRDPDERFQSAQEMGNELARVAAALPDSMPLERFAELLYTTVRTGRRSPALDEALRSDDFEAPRVSDRVRRMAPRAAVAATPAAPRDEILEETLLIKRRPGMAMLTGMVLTLAVILGLFAFFYKPRDVSEAIRAGAEALSQPGAPAQPVVAPASP